MQGLLADVHLQGHMPYLRRLLELLDLWSVLDQLGLQLVTFPDLELAPDLDDRTLWNLCQKSGWILFTENRNEDGLDSLETTLGDSWKSGHLPVLTLANKPRFENSRQYAERVATDVAEILFGASQGGYRDQRRIWVPFSN